MTRAARCRCAALSVTADALAHPREPLVRLRRRCAPARDVAVTLAACELCDPDVCAMWRVHVTGVAGNLRPPKRSGCGELAHVRLARIRNATITELGADVTAQTLAERWQPGMLGALCTGVAVGACELPAIEIEREMQPMVKRDRVLGCW